MVSVYRNAGYLTLIHGVNLLAPIIIVPYMISTLGLKIYGELVLAQSILFYLTLLVGFGINLVATKDIALNRSSKLICSRIVNTVFLAKFLIFLVVFSLFILVIFFLGVENRFKLILILTSWMLIQEVTIPDWYFQGIEKIEILTIINFISKVFTVVYIFLVVKSEDDFFHAPLAFLFGVILSTFLSFFYIYFVDKNSFSLVGFNDIKSLILESMAIFLSKISQLYIRLNKILIGTFLPIELVSFYDLGEKFVNLYKIPVSLFGQAIFPSFVLKKNKGFILRNMYVFLLFYTIVIIVNFIFGERVISYFVPEFTGNAYFFLILCFTLIPITFNVFLGNTLLFGSGFKNQYAKTIATGGFTYIICMVFIYLNNLWSLNVVSTIVVLSEITCTLLTIFYLKLLYVKR